MPFSTLNQCYYHAGIYSFEELVLLLGEAVVQVLLEIGERYLVSVLELAVVF